MISCTITSLAENPGEVKVGNPKTILGQIETQFALRGPSIPQVIPQGHLNHWGFKSLVLECRAKNEIKKTIYIILYVLK